jgi:hypothetical protein
LAENLGLMSFLRKKLALKTKKPGAKNLGIYLKLEVVKLSTKYYGLKLNFDKSKKLTSISLSLPLVNLCS